MRAGIKVLVFGGAGQLGSCLARTQPTGLNVTYVDREECDLTVEGNAAALIANIAPKCVINAAAYTAVDRAETERELAQRINAGAVAEMARASCAIDARFLHVSTDYVFDGKKKAPYLPDDVPAPLNVYGETKLAGERAAQAECANAWIVRTSWVYSPFGNNFVKTMLRLMRERETLQVVDDQFGSPTSADNLARVLWALIDGHVKPGIYHYCDGAAISWHDFACEIAATARQLDVPLTAKQIEKVTSAQFVTAASRPAYGVLKPSPEVNVVARGATWQQALRAVLAELRPESQV